MTTLENNRKEPGDRINDTELNQIFTDVVTMSATIDKDNTGREWVSRKHIDWGSSPCHPSTWKLFNTSNVWTTSSETPSVPILGVPWYIVTNKTMREGDVFRITYSQMVEMLDVTAGFLPESQAYFQFFYQYDDGAGLIDEAMSCVYGFNGCINADPTVPPGSQHRLQYYRHQMSHLYINPVEGRNVYAIYVKAWVENANHTLHLKESDFNIIEVKG